MSHCWTLIVTAPMGLESVVARKLQQLGYKTSTENGRVLFTGSPLDVCPANLWLRSADRILVKIAQFAARTFDE